MNIPFLPLHFAGIVGLGLPELIIVAVAIGTMVVLPITIVAIALYFKHRQQQMWHESARLALERGQPLPTPLAGIDVAAVGSLRAERNDIRTGLILIAVGIGLAVFFKTVGAREATGIGAIPGCIGVALLLFGLFSRPKSSAKDLPPRT